MNFCPQCGNTISSGKPFCSNCGYKFSGENLKKESVGKSEESSPISFKKQSQGSSVQSNEYTIIYFLYVFLFLNSIAIGWFLYHPQTLINIEDEMSVHIHNKFIINILVLLNLIGIVLSIINKCFFLIPISFLLTIVYFVGLYIKPNNYLWFDYKFNDESLAYSMGLIVSCIVSIVIQNFKSKKR